MVTFICIMPCSQQEFECAFPTPSGLTQARAWELCGELENDPFIQSCNDKLESTLDTTKATVEQCVTDLMASTV